VVIKDIIQSRTRNFLKLWFTN